MRKLLPALPLLLLVFAPASHAAPSGTVADSQTGATYTVMEGDDIASRSIPSTSFGFINSGTLAPQMGTTGCPYLWNSRAEWAAAGSPRQSNACVNVGGQVVTHIYSRLRFPDIPAADRSRFTPTAKLSYVEYVVEGQVVQVGDVIVNDRATFEIGSPTETYCNWYTQGWGTDSFQPGIARKDTPPSVYAACAALGLYRGHAGDTEATKPATSAPARIVIPRNAARCRAVGRVVVRATAVKCASARSVVARYARSLRSPAGWTCSAVVNDAGRRVKCSPKATTSRAAERKAVYGVWKAT